MQIPTIILTVHATVRYMRRAICLALHIQKTLKNGVKSHTRTRA